eukprot:13354887-Heterocapsa_arctica.AAC.1
MGRRAGVLRFANPFSRERIGLPVRSSGAFAGACGGPGRLAFSFASLIQRSSSGSSAAASSSASSSLSCSSSSFSETGFPIPSAASSLTVSSAASAASSLSLRASALLMLLGVPVGVLGDPGAEAPP